MLEFYHLKNNFCNVPCFYPANIMQQKMNTWKAFDTNVSEH